MFGSIRKIKLSKTLSEGRKFVAVHADGAHFDSSDPLHSIREYRLRKVASKRIPSRIN